MLLIILYIHKKIVPCHKTETIKTANKLLQANCQIKKITHIKGNALIKNNIN